MSEVTVAIPVRNGGQLLSRALDALALQTVAHELLICDSGSTDGSVELAREHGARVLEISPEHFSHGRTRNRLMDDASGTHVALLTQDAEPADEHWLERLLDAFAIEPDVAIAYGPYIPRPDAAFAVRVELEHWFASLAPDARPRIERLEPHERTIRPIELMGTRGFFTDANACISRNAWERVPFRDVPYAEDRVLALDMLRAGYAKAYVPAAAVLHSHDYTTAEQVRRCFDEWRGLLEVYGWREPLAPRSIARRLRGDLGMAYREMSGARLTWRERVALLVAASRHHMARLAGAQLGSHADRLPAAIRRRLSLERRASFVSLDLDIPPTAPTNQDPQP